MEADSNFVRDMIGSQRTTIAWGSDEFLVTDPQREAMKRALEKITSVESAVSLHEKRLVPPPPRPAPEPQPAAEPEPEEPVVNQAASWLTIAQSLEKKRNIPLALKYYRRIVKEFPDSESAVTAAERIKALD